MKPLSGKTKKVDISKDEPVYTSGVVCRLLDIPVWVLKQLDKEKVVRPTRQQGRARLYSHRELDKLQHVWHYMRIRHVNVHGIKVILEMEQKWELK
jgi:MerR family transcriptional regulator, heat shock protein HspR